MRAPVQSCVLPILSMGRIVRSNHLLVNGEPVERSAAGSDPLTPVKTSDMSVLIAGSDQISTVDASSDNDLLSVAQTIASDGPSTIAVGSGGLADALAVTLSRDFPSSRPFDIADAFGHRKPSRILLQVSSLNPVSHAQVARLSGVFPDIIVLLAPTARVGGLSVAEDLAAKLTKLVAEEPWDLIGLVGGDGARAALRNLGVSAIRIADSVVEGIPFGVFVGGVADGMPVFTKAGGFGDEDALVRVVERFRR